MSAALHLAADRRATPAAPPAQSPSRPSRLRLLLSAASGAQALLALKTVVRRHRVDLVGLQRHVDPATGWYHYRSEIDGTVAQVSADDLRGTLASLVAQGSMRAQVGATHERKRVVVLVSKADHCLLDLFRRQREGELDVDIACVISNHADLEPLARAHGVPFHHLPMPTPGPAPSQAGRTSSSERESTFERIFELYEQYRGDVMALARFMQILPPPCCARAAGRILNVHHSLLPAFSGARAYHQAWQHGVKWIGATCHYVTAELDQGPIIEQDARRVDQAQSVDDLVRAGRELECSVLSAGLRAHVEDRVALCGSRTFVFGH